MEKTSASARHSKRLGLERMYDEVFIYIKKYAEMVHWKYCPMVKKVETRWIGKEHVRSR
jgi:hypothetical protein